MAIRLSPALHVLYCIVAILVILGCVGYIFLPDIRAWRERAPTTRGPKSFTLLGRIAMEETVKVAGVKGKLVIVVPSRPDDSLNLALQEFEKRMKKQNAVLIRQTIPVPPSPYNAPWFMTSNSVFTADVFFSVLKSHPDMTAMVSFAGVPNLNDEEIAGLAPSTPPLIVIATSAPKWNLSLDGIDKLLSEQVIARALYPRAELPPSPKRLRTERDRFEYEFETRTSAVRPPSS